MGLEQIIIRTQREIGGVQVDAVLKESTVESVRTTTNPVESGRDITDHIIINPRSITIEGVITDTPLGTRAIANIVSNIGGAFDPNGTYGASNLNGQTRSQLLYSKLVDKLKQRKLMTVTTRLKEYTNLVFKSISVDQDKDTSLAVFFTAVFDEALIVIDATVRTNLPKQDTIQGDDASAGYSEYENGGNFDLSQASDVQMDSLSQ